MNIIESASRYSYHSNRTDSPVNRRPELLMTIEMSRQVVGNSCYELSAETGVYTRNGASDIGYRDGGESNLSRIIDSIEDRATFSTELVKKMSDWPTEYHFSRKRHLVLRPFNIKRGDRVLELGSGCGSITRYLAEIGAEVTAVEGELSRAAIAAKRCSGFNNVRIIADNFLTLNIPGEFDWLLMIGVLEYSQKYAKSTDRQADYINIARKHLKPDGTLIIAIENKLGIKYLNGAGEDHNGKRFYGPHDLYTGDDITTWGRAELREILARSGFSAPRFFGVFPDYKLPKVIFSEAIDDFRNFRAEELVHYSKSLDYRGKNERVFDESLALASFRKNGIMTDVANSFLVACRLDREPVDCENDVLAHYFSVDRQPHLCTHTRFKSHADGLVKVMKRPLANDENQTDCVVCVTTLTGDVLRISHHVEELSTKYLDGRLMGFEISKSLKKGGGSQLNSLLETWAAFLVHSFKMTCPDTNAQLSLGDLRGRALAAVLIDGAALDCGPQNIIIGERIRAFDLEWQADAPIPLAWVLNRNAKHVLRTRHSSKLRVQPPEIVEFVARLLGLTAAPADIAGANYLEQQFQAEVAIVEPSNLTPLRDALEWS